MVKERVRQVHENGALGPKQRAANLSIRPDSAEQDAIGGHLSEIDGGGLDGAVGDRPQGLVIDRQDRRGGDHETVDLAGDGLRTVNSFDGADKGRLGSASGAENRCEFSMFQDFQDFGRERFARRLIEFVGGSCQESSTGIGPRRRRQLGQEFEQTMDQQTAAEAPAVVSA